MFDEYPYDKCPFCGNDTFIINQHAEGMIKYRCNFDKSIEEDNSQMYDLLNVTNRKYATCENCGKRLFPINDYV